MSQLHVAAAGTAAMQAGHLQLWLTIGTAGHFARSMLLHLVTKLLTGLSLLWRATSHENLCAGHKGLATILHSGASCPGAGWDAAP